MEVGLEAAGLGVVEEVFGVGGLDEAGVALVELVVGGRFEAVAGRDAAAVPVVGL